MRFDRVSGLLELVRWQGRGLRGDPSAVRGLLDSCYVALEVGLPDDFILTGMCVLEQASERMGASSDSFKSDFPKICDYGREVDDLNRKALAMIARRLEELGIAPGDALLLGDPAVLLGLFKSSCAFRANTWAVGVPGAVLDSEDSVTEHAVVGLPFDVRFGRLNRLEQLAGGRTETVEVDGIKWSAVAPALLVCFMAARVGEPEASPMSNTWSHLAAALKAYKDELDLDEVLRIADELEIAGRVHRGLAIVRVLFPELGVVIEPGRLDIPAWERVALRLAAHKLVRGAIGDDV